MRGDQGPCYSRSIVLRARRHNPRPQLPNGWGHFFDRAMGSIASLPSLRFNSAMPQDPFIREKFTKERTAARKHAAPLIRGDNLMSFLRNPPRPLAFGVEAAGGKNQNQKGVKQHG